MEEVLTDFGLTMAEFEAMGRQPVRVQDRREVYR
jgi:hypothetical protein